MLLDALFASVLSTVIFLGLFALTESIILTDAINLQLTVSQTHLRSVEGYWRIAKFLGRDIPIGDNLCEVSPPWLLQWCNDWRQIKRDWAIEGLLCIQEDSKHVIAMVRLHGEHCFNSDGPLLKHRWLIN